MELSDAVFYAWGNHHSVDTVISSNSNTNYLFHKNDVIYIVHSQFTIIYIISVREKESVWGYRFSSSPCNSLGSQHVGRRPEDGGGEVLGHWSRQERT